MAMANPTSSTDHCSLQQFSIHDYYDFLKCYPTPPAKTSCADEIDVTRQRIGIIGAGMAGLYAALILDSLGITNYEILEANSERVGGRVYTRYFRDVDDDDTTSSSSSSRNKYVELGAMRIPKIPVMDRLLSLVPYLNDHIPPNTDIIKLTPYFLTVDNNIMYYNGTRCTRAEFASQGSSDPLNFGISKGGGIPDEYLRRPVKDLLEEVFKALKKSMDTDFPKAVKKLLHKDHLSTRTYLLRKLLKKKQKSNATSELHAYDEDVKQIKSNASQHAKEDVVNVEKVIDYMEALLCGGTGGYDNSLTEAVIDDFVFEGSKVEWVCVDGGLSRLPTVMEQVIQNRVQKGSRVTKIKYTGKFVDVYVAGEVHPKHYDHVINTMPPSVLRTIDISECKFSYEKRRALTALRVGFSIKIGLLFKKRWWQDIAAHDEVRPIRGGESSTDLPIRKIVYPSYGSYDSPGVLLACYARDQDAVRFGSFIGDDGEQKLVQLALSNIAEVHGLRPQDVQEIYTGQYFVQNWNHDEYSQAPFAFFSPGQFVSLYPGLVAQEMGGRYHTGGEMASWNHGWIVGALNSAWRCVFEILQANNVSRSQIDELINTWGPAPKEVNVDAYNI